jgi:hypothetical protein
MDADEHLLLPGRATALSHQLELVATRFSRAPCMSRVHRASALDRHGMSVAMKKSPLVAR